MDINVIKVGAQKTLGVINTDKFKFNHFLMGFVLDRTEENIANALILSRVLCRGSIKYPDIKAINRKLSMLYGANVSVNVASYTQKMMLRVTLSYLDDAFLPENDKCDITGEIIQLVKELLLNTLTEGQGLCKEYTEQEKKHQKDDIRAQINNKDGYALRRFNTLIFEGTPMALDMQGTQESVDKVTAESAYGLLQKMLRESRVEAAFVGRADEKKVQSFTALIDKVSGAKLDGDTAESEPVALKEHATPPEIYEEIDAKQGRMLLSYVIPEYDPECNAVAVFNEIFGASPISRLFMNVRERLGLCYYCASSCNTNLRYMIVRSGLDHDKSELAKEEIKRQLQDLSVSENISDQELDAAKLAIRGTFTAIEDNASQMCLWYIARVMMKRDTDIEKCKRAVEVVNAHDVARIAQNCKLNLVYFLNGTDNER